MRPRDDPSCLLQIKRQTHCMMKRLNVEREIVVKLFMSRDYAVLKIDGWSELLETLNI